MSVPIHDCRVSSVVRVFLLFSLMSGNSTAQDDSCINEETCPPGYAYSHTADAARHTMMGGDPSASTNKVKKGGHVRGEHPGLNFCNADCLGQYAIPTKMAIGLYPSGKTKCIPCECSSKCKQEDTCVTRLSDKQSDIVEVSSLELYSPTEKFPLEVPQQLECARLNSSVQGHYLFVRKCSQQGVDQQTRKQCEEETPLGEQTMANYLHVSDQWSKIVFKNKFCSQCNALLEEMKVDSWSLSIDCVHYMRVYQAISEDQLLQLSLVSPSSCSVSQWPPSADHYTPCDPIWFGDIISQCNATGLWEKETSPLAEACSRKSPFANRVFAILTSGSQQESALLFDNIHCVSCNLGDFQVKSPCKKQHHNQHHGSPGGHRPRLPFSMLLGMREPKLRFEYYTQTVDPGNCTDSEWASPDGVCLPLACPPGKIVGLDNCSTALGDIKGLGYLIYLHLTIQMKTKNRTGRESNTLKIEKLDDKVLKEAVKFLFSSLPLDGYDINVKCGNEYTNESLQIDSSSFYTEDQHHNKECFVSAYIVANTSLERDYAEQILVDSLEGNMTITDAKFNDLYITYQSVLPLNGDKKERKPKLNKGEGSNDFILKRKIKDAKRNKIWKEKKLFIPLSNTLNCLSVKFKPRDFKMEKKGDLWWKITLIFKTAKITLSDSLELIGVSVGEDGSLSVCRHLLEGNVIRHEFVRVSYADFGGATSFWQSLLTHICIGASMACLAVTVITYAIFGSLRTPAGWHNLLLALTLLLAQCLLLISTYANGPSALCTALGMATHYTWVSMFCWSCACCFYMFRVFTAKTRSSQHSSAKDQRLGLLKRVILSAVAPALVVIAVIVSVLISTDGEDIGYGKSRCYLDSGFLVGVATLLPLGVVTTCNMIFFAVVVFKIYTVRKLQSNDAGMKQKATNFFVYVRLSTLTGVCWLVAVLAEAVDSDPLRFIYIILNGLQGVFIFVSYICNKRVFALYMGREAEKKDATSTSSTRVFRTKESSQGFSTGAVSSVSTTD